MASFHESSTAIPSLSGWLSGELPEETWEALQNVTVESPTRYVSRYTKQWAIHQDAVGSPRTLGFTVPTSLSSVSECMEVGGDRNPEMIHTKIEITIDPLDQFRTLVIWAMLYYHRMKDYEGPDRDLGHRSDLIPTEYEQHA
ncbi:predicted protein [Histoplasma capsulatum G186AR]|uniref:Uncharacterized protein n=1 Tax=Ajellomyces capsulatus (strain G186AR / H82 / ATCC MYA-2454 / RMSCC 2432) TaxID=447093 RepID=C0NPX7_AJECG|nr:uncharacterized protein HCBG_05207 [Histoplasma capsulatum G186AR]EEH06987.1 predicted protein [Histoplasma capsulatum G186AR]